MIQTDLAFIIPALNEEAHIGYALDAIVENVHGRLSYSAIVVDNGSTDRTVEIARGKGATCLDAPGCSISSLRNLGASEAGSDIYVFLDADVYLGKEWGARIGVIMERLYNQPDIITGSLYGISEDNNWIERNWFAPRTMRKETNYMNGGHLIIHRNLFTRVGGFDPGLETGEDYEFCARAKGMGARIENDPELKVVHAGYPRNIKSFYARERWHARGDYKSLKTVQSSKPALVCFLNLCMAAVCTIGILSNPKAWLAFLLVYLLFLTSVSFASSFHRYGGRLNSGFISTVFLYIVYFTARTVSLADVVLQHLAKRVSALVRHRS